MQGDEDSLTVLRVNDRREAAIAWLGRCCKDASIAPTIHMRSPLVVSESVRPARGASVCANYPTLPHGTVESTR